MPTKLPDLETMHAVGKAARRAVRGDLIPTIAPFTDKAGAERYARALGNIRKALVAEDKRMRRMRNVPPDYARQLAELTETFRAVAELHEAIQIAHGIGGY